MKQSCFVDTSFFKAFVDPKDDFHAKAIQIFEQLKKESIMLVTSNFIIDETLTLIRYRCGLERAKEFKSILEQFETDFKIVRVLSRDEANAWDWFTKDWSKLSFTDCVSFAMMKRLELKRVAVFDEDFKRAGFLLESY